MTDREQIKEIRDILLNSNAITFEPNVERIPTYGNSLKNMFYVSANDGHVTIDYSEFAKALYNAGYRKVDEVRKETAEKFVKFIEDYECIVPWPDLDEFCKQFGVEIKE